MTIFIGGNHEASNHLQELSYGGWAAPNIYYMGLAGVINVGGLRIGGLSGIYKANDYVRGRHERPPYTEQTIRSIYHVRQLEVFRLKQVTIFFFINEKLCILVDGIENLEYIEIIVHEQKSSNII